MSQATVKMTSEPRLLEIDLNPDMLHPLGAGAIALDALLLVS